MARILTKIELLAFDKRVDEITFIAELCHPSFDADVLDALDAELNDISNILETSLEEAELYECQS